MPAMSLIEPPPAAHCFTPEHAAFRRTVRDWAAREIKLKVAAWHEGEGWARQHVTFSLPVSERQRIRHEPDLAARQLGI